MILGRETHYLLFGETNWKKLFVLRPDRLGGEAWHGNRSACKLWLKQRAEEGLAVISETQLARIKGMATALARHPLVQAGILNGAIEHSIFWKDQKTSVWWKTRPDAVPGDSADVADLKTISWVDDDTSA